MEWGIDIIVPFPKIQSGKRKGQLATLNKLPYFYRYGITKLKNEFKDMMKNWYIPEHTGKKYRWAEIHYTILRENKRKIDSDSNAIWTKYVQDVLVEQGYLIDDDQCRVVLEPTLLGQKCMETCIKIQVKFYME